MPTSDRQLETKLREIHRRGEAPRPEASDALEEELDARFAAAFDGTQPRPRRPSRRGWIIGGLAGAALVGACALPAEYELSIGHRVALVMTGESPVPPHELARHIESSFEVDEIRIAVRKTRRTTDAGEEAATMVALDVVGPDVDADALETSLVAAFPTLAEADFEVDALEGTVRGTIGGMLSHRMIDVVIDTEGVEAARERILADLEARGLDGDATVEIEDEETPDGHRRRVRIEVEAHSRD